MFVSCHVSMISDRVTTGFVS